MSAILQALKKSQAHRQQVAPPHSAPSLAPAYRYRHGRGPLLWLAVLLLPLAMALLYFWQQPPALPEAPGPTTNAAVPLPTQTRIAKQAPASLATPVKQPPFKQPPAQQIEPHPHQEAQVDPLPRENTADTPVMAGNADQDIPTVKESPVATPRDTGLQKTVRHGNTPTEPSMADDRLLHVFQIPQAMRLELEKLQVNVIQYNPDPQLSWVLINMQKHREGDQLPGAFYLREIRPQSLVLQQGEIRFEWPVGR